MFRLSHKEPTAGPSMSGSDGPVERPLPARPDCARVGMDSLEKLGSISQLICLAGLWGSCERRSCMIATLPKVFGSSIRLSGKDSKPKIDIGEHENASAETGRYRSVIGILRGGCGSGSGRPGQACGRSIIRTSAGCRRFGSGQRGDGPGSPMPGRLPDGHVGRVRQGPRDPDADPLSDGVSHRERAGYPVVQEVVNENRTVTVCVPKQETVNQTMTRIVCEPVSVVKKFNRAVPVTKNVQRTINQVRYTPVTTTKQVTRMVPECVTEMVPVTRMFQSSSSRPATSRRGSRSGRWSRS